MKILVAGGAGYIGTHTCVTLLEAGHEIVVVDSLENSRISSIRRVENITGRDVGFVEADVRNRKALNQLFSKQRIDAVVNFAGYKAVGESCNKPLDYYDNNLNCAIALLECMSRHGVKLFVFSSSATVYGDLAELPVSEDAGLAPQNPYGRTKRYIEEMLTDLAHSDRSWKMAILRYFNPVGAHPSGMIGERVTGIPSNLMPCITKVATGELEKLSIFGGDYDTPDGTAIRDYIHVMDLARGHGKALQKLESLDEGKVVTVNLGTGKGYSVLEILKTFEQVCGRTIPFEIVARREGDVPICYSDSKLARHEIGWQSEHGIYDMCRDAWNWQLQLDKFTRFDD